MLLLRGELAKCDKWCSREVTTRLTVAVCEVAGKDGTAVGDFSTHTATSESRRFVIHEGET